MKQNRTRLEREVRSLQADLDKQTAEVRKQIDPVVAPVTDAATTVRARVTSLV